MHRIDTVIIVQKDQTGVRAIDHHHIPRFARRFNRCHRGAKIGFVKGGITVQSLHGPSIGHQQEQKQPRAGKCRQYSQPTALRQPVEQRLTEQGDRRRRQQQEKAAHTHGVAFMEIGVAQRQPIDDQERRNHRGEQTKGCPKSPKEPQADTQ